eukprot:4088994-Prymnesium_polylepis.1
MQKWRREGGAVPPVIAESLGEEGSRMLARELAHHRDCSGDEILQIGKERAADFSKVSSSCVITRGFVLCVRHSCETARRWAIGLWSESRDREWR